MSTTTSTEPLREMTGMYFWNSRSLAHQLKTGKLSERERAKYLLATLLTIIIPIPPTIRFLDKAPAADVLGQTILAIVATILGVWVCFAANRKGDDREFLDRFICLGWTTAIRVAAGFLAVWIAYILLSQMIEHHIFRTDHEYSGVLNLLIAATFDAIFYWRLRNWMRFVSQFRERSRSDADAPPASIP
jgi:hypothetical protein